MSARGRIVVACCAFSVCMSCVPKSRTVTTETGLEYRIVVPGTGPAARPGDSVRIHETTTLADGSLIYSTRTKNNPVTFLLGGNQVIAGVDAGVTGIRMGERRTLVVPPFLSKRSSYPENTPSDATLHYDIELVEILPATRTAKPGKEGELRSLTFVEEWLDEEALLAHRVTEHVRSVMSRCPDLRRHRIVG